MDPREEVQKAALEHLGRVRETGCALRVCHAEMVAAAAPGPGLSEALAGPPPRKLRGLRNRAWTKNLRFANSPLKPGPARAWMIRRARRPGAAGERESHEGPTQGGRSRRESVCRVGRVRPRPRSRDARTVTSGAICSAPSTFLSPAPPSARTAPRASCPPSQPTLLMRAPRWAGATAELRSGRAACPAAAWAGAPAPGPAYSPRPAADRVTPRGG